MEGNFHTIEFKSRILLPYILKGVTMKKVKLDSGGRSYPLWDNYRTAFRWICEVEGAGYFVILGVSTVIAVVQPFLAMALPGAVVSLLGSGREPGIIFSALAAYVLILQGLLAAGGWLRGQSDKKKFLFRIKMGPQLFEAAMDADYQAFESTKGQKKLNAAKLNFYLGNREGIEDFLKQFEGFWVNFLGLTLYCAVIGRQNPAILLLLLLTSGASATIRFYGGQRAGRYDDKYEKVWQECGYLGKEVLIPAHGKDIRLYHMWNWFSREFERLKKEFIDWGIKWWKCSKGNAVVVEKCITLVRDVLVYGYLISQMANGRMELGAFLIYIGIVGGFGGWMNPLLDTVSMILKDNRHMNHYRDYLEFCGEIRGGKETVSRPGQVHEICLEHVSFRYEGNEEDTIRDVSLTILPGEKIALVGMNGAGKSTLIKLICGLYQPTSGRITLDGRDISELSLKEYQKEFAVVFQDVFAFSFSLEDNVSCREENSMERERLILSLQEAGLWERVQSLEKKERTYLNKDIDASGVTLSGGEQQKLMLARALYKDAPVVILDEPTAALDPIAESSLYEKYDELTKRKTSIFISHRLSSTKFCDRILFLENGRITEEGRHEELMAKQGAYAAVFRTQARYYDTEKAGGEVLTAE